MEAQGIAHRADGKVVFVEGALPFETVSVNTHRKKASFDKASITAIHRESSQRVTPGCPHFGMHTGACGGCKMQHMHADAQVAVKQRVLEDNLWHLGRVRPDTMLRPIHGPTWGYRYRGRLSVRFVRKKGEVLVGFHERKSGYVADMRACRVLPPFVSALLLPLRGLIQGMQARETCPQIELAVGDDGPTQVVALVLRHMEPLVEADKDLLRAFADQHAASVDGRRHVVQWWLQPGGLDTVALLDEGGAQLAYTLPEFGIRMPFRPTDFTQVNPLINQVLVGRALRLLAVGPNERVIDWFCGLGNFTLALATLAGDGHGRGGQSGPGRPGPGQRTGKRTGGSRWPIAGADAICHQKPVRDGCAGADRRRRRAQMAARPATRGRICAGPGTGAGPSGGFRSGPGRRRRGRAVADR